MQCALTPTHECAYTRQLSNVNPELFAVAIHTVDGQVYWRERERVSVCPYGWRAAHRPEPFVARRSRCGPRATFASTSPFNHAASRSHSQSPCAIVAMMSTDTWATSPQAKDSTYARTHARPLVLQSPPTCPLTPLLAVGLLVESRPQTIQPIDQLWSHRDLVVAVARARPCRGTAAPAARHILVAQHLRSLADLVTG